ncbi:MAG TPA: hypothetical protein VLZ89_12570 [Anaerolineales bacterium]|nr:hypothetical protein [Anaerolineales bacterium]
MRFFKASLRTLIMLASTFSFLGGWVLLAHSLKPTSSSSSASSAAAAIVPGNAAAALPTLAPLPGLNSQQIQSMPQNPLTIIAQPQQPQLQAMPMFRTSGS